MKKLYILFVLLFLVGCGNHDNSIKPKGVNSDNNSSIDSIIDEVATTNTNSSLSSNTSVDEVVPATDNNSSSTNPIDSKLGKAQLGVISDAIVKIYELNAGVKTLVATETTSKGNSIETIGNFDIHLEKLDDNKFYIYEISGGEDYDVEDNGVINTTPTPNIGVFHAIVKGSSIKSVTNARITIVSEILYQKALPFITLSTSKIEEKLNIFSKEIIQKDINEDGVIGLNDILQYDPIHNKSKLFSSYQVQIRGMINNILNGKAFDFEEDRPSTGGINYPRTENGIQQALDNSNYDYVISQLINNRDAYGDINNDEVNMNIAGAYVGKSGYTVFDIVGAISDSSSGLNSFVNKTTKNNNAVNTIDELKNADSYYSAVINGLDCNDTSGLTTEQESSCFNLGLVRLTSLSNSVKLLFGGDEDVVKKWADGVEINSTDDLNGNSVIDSSDASACAIVYANNSSDNCRDGSMATYRKRVIFTKSGVEYNTTLIDIDVGSTTYGYNTFNKLVTNKNSNNSVILTDGVCDINFNKSSSSIDGVTYFPCPVLNNGALINIADSLSNASNIQALFPAGSESKTTIENYLNNITGSKDGVIDQTNLSTYLQSH
jgi:hypothetical protein